MPVEKTLNYLRAWPWLALALVAILVVFLIAPHQIGVLIWSLSKVALGAYLGYWIHRSINMVGPRPHEMEAGPEKNAVLLNRAIIIAATIVALGLGV
jgi:hypothetical protein